MLERFEKFLEAISSSHVILPTSEWTGLELYDNAYCEENIGTGTYLYSLTLVKTGATDEMSVVTLNNSRVGFELLHAHLHHYIITVQHKFGCHWSGEYIKVSPQVV